MAKKKRQYRRYTVKTKRRAEKDLAKIQKSDALAIAKRINGLEANPRPHGYRKLRDTDDLYRVQQGDYRVIYHISDNPPKVTITHIGHRGDVYRGV